MACPRAQNCPLHCWDLNLGGSTCIYNSLCSKGLSPHLWMDGPKRPPAVIFLSSCFPLRVWGCQSLLRTPSPPTPCLTAPPRPPTPAGRRLCLGESLARMELFIFLTFILQNFTLQPLEAPEDIDLTPISSGLGNVPRPYELRLHPR